MTKRRRRCRFDAGREEHTMETITASTGLDLDAIRDHLVKWDACHVVEQMRNGDGYADLFAEDVRALLGEVEWLRRGVVHLWEKFGSGEKHTSWNGCACPDPDVLGGEFAELLGLDYFADLADGRALLDDRTETT